MGRKLRSKEEQRAERAKHKRVGVAGFEPTTPSTPRKCATRLRYTPIIVSEGSKNKKIRG